MCPLADFPGIVGPRSLAPVAIAAIRPHYSGTPGKLGLARIIPAGTGYCVSLSRLRKTTPKGGRVSTIEWGCPWHSPGSDVTGSKLIVLLPL